MKQHQLGMIACNIVLRHMPTRSKSNGTVMWGLHRLYMITRRLRFKYSDFNVTIILCNYMWMSHYLCLLISWIRDLILVRQKQLAHLMSWEAQTESLRDWMRARFLTLGEKDLLQPKRFTRICIGGQAYAQHFTRASTACPLASKWTSKYLSMHTSMLGVCVWQEKLTYTCSSDSSIAKLYLRLVGEKKFKWHLAASYYGARHSINANRHCWLAFDIGQFSSLSHTNGSDC